MLLTGRIFLFILAFAIAVYALTFFSFETEGNFLSNKPEVLLDSFFYRLAFYLHVGGGAVALAIGPFQFLPRLRKKRLSLHRVMGKVYLIAILLSSLAGFSLAFFAQGGLPTGIGFGLLAVFWFFTSLMAYIHIRQKKIALHREWMLRSFSLTFAAVTLRLWLALLLAGFRWSFDDAYLFVAYMCWIPNLLVMELILQWPKWRRRFNRASPSAFSSHDLSAK
ncbi:MAG: DUF2306 domain-containing protein [Bacteroidia bacterium]|nr:DUF2306 domain-containing protein [Bacteroidia bacterium]